MPLCLLLKHGNNVQQQEQNPIVFGRILDLAKVRTQGSVIKGIRNWLNDVEKFETQHSDETTLTKADVGTKPEVIAGTASTAAY